MGLGTVSPRQRRITSIPLAVDSLSRAMSQLVMICAPAAKRSSFRVGSVGAERLVSTGRTPQMIEPNPRKLGSLCAPAQSPRGTAASHVAES